MWHKATDPIEVGKAYFNYNLDVVIVLQVMGEYDGGVVWYDTTCGMFDGSRLASHVHDTLPYPSARTLRRAYDWFTRGGHALSPREDGLGFEVSPRVAG
jgi:hypothetical protein